MQVTSKNQRYYHAASCPRKYFEGWYYKITTGRHTLVLIPSIHADAKGNLTAMLQVVLDGEVYAARYPGDMFQASQDVLDIRIGRSRFTQTSVALSVESGGLVLEGELAFGPIAPIAENIMGPFQHLPIMQCNHGVISMRHCVEGGVRINRQEISFNHAVGYIETDWGHSFPNAYLWTQCNEWPDVSMMASVADVPVGPISFTGCICHVCINDKEYRIATYHGARAEMFAPYRMVLRQGRYVFAATCLEKRPVSLHAPVSGTMSRTIQESPACTVRYQLIADGKPLLDRTGITAGFEYAMQ